MRTGAVSAEAESRPRPGPEPNAGDGRGQRLAAFAVYLAISILFFGLRLLPHMSHSYLGYSRDRADPDAFFWFLRWWPYAISHGLDPFTPHLIWAPSGINLATATSVPGASLLALPVTLTAGPVVAYNLLMLLSPALAAWTAFLLCRYVTKAFWPALVGGYLFGFSTYEIAQMTAHLNLALVFLVPVCVYLVVRRINGDIRPAAFVALLALALLGQFLFSLEVAATMTMFGVLTLAVAAVVTAGEPRRRILQTSALVAGSYAAAAVVSIPYLIAFFGSGGPQTHVVLLNNSADLVNFLVPGPTTALGHRALGSVSAHFVGNYPEIDAYVGLPLLAAAVAFGATAWRSATGKLLLGVLAVILALSLGPDLVIAGSPTIPLPWRVALHVPVIRLALPARFMLYAFLVLAVMASLWLRAAPRSRRGWLRWGLAALAVAFLFPNVTSAYWHGTTVVPSFFADGTYHRYLVPGERVLVLPYGRRGADAMLWQAETGMDFRMPQGYVSCDVPDQFRRWPILASLLSRIPVDHAWDQMKAFLAWHDVRTIIVEKENLDDVPGRWLLRALKVEPRDVGGVLLYRVPGRVLAAPHPYAYTSEKVPPLSNCV